MNLKQISELMLILMRRMLPLKWFTAVCPNFVPFVSQRVLIISEVYDMDINGHTGALFFIDESLDLCIYAQLMSHTAGRVSLIFSVHVYDSRVVMVIHNLKKAYFLGCSVLCCWLLTHRGRQVLQLISRCFRLECCFHSGRSVLLRVPTELHQCYRVFIHIRSIGAKCQYLGSRLCCEFK